MDRIEMLENELALVRQQNEHLHAVIKKLKKELSDRCCDIIVLKTEQERRPLQ